MNQYHVRYQIAGHAGAITVVARSHELAIKDEHHEVTS